MKNIRKRVDGRWEFRKMVKGIRQSIIKNTKQELLEEISYLKKQRLTLETYTPTKKTFYELAKTWFDLFKKGKIVSENNYKMYINNDMSKGIFLLDIKKIELPDLQMWVNSLQKTPTKARYCYQIIKNVFKYALQLDIIKKDISQFLQPIRQKNETRQHLNLEEQKLFLNNLNQSPIKYELLFYVLTGCRPEEGRNVKKKDINFERHMLFINGTKTKSAKRYVPISEQLCNILEQNFDNMFKCHPDYYNRSFIEYLKNLGITGKSLYSLRHTFNTNLFYLGVPDKIRQSYMGHSSIVMTNDIYTHIDPTITKNDILKLYNNLYPEF